MEEFKNHILNEKNKYVTKEFIEGTLRKYGIEHKVKNLSAYQTAFVHTSYLSSTVPTDKLVKLLKEIPEIEFPETAIPLQKNSYESLEFLGDAVIHSVIAEYLLKRYPDKDPGFFTKLRTKIEKGETLNKISRRLNFHEYAIFARNIEISGGRTNNKNIMEDIFEAFIGALKLETTYETCQKFISNLMELEIDFAEMISVEDNYKEMLMQHYHRQGYTTTPTYSLIRVIEEKPRKKFEMAALDPEGKVMGKGISTSKSTAAQYAAQEALKKVGILENHEDEEEYYMVEE